MRVDEGRITAAYILASRRHGTLYLRSMKKWRRDWKINLIERDNPHWDDLYPALIGAELPKQS